MGITSKVGPRRPFIHEVYLVEIRLYIIILDSPELLLPALTRDGCSR